MNIKNIAKSIVLLCVISFPALSLEVQISLLTGQKERPNLDGNMTIPEFEAYIRERYAIPGIQPILCVKGKKNILEYTEKTIGQIFTGRRGFVGFDGCIVVLVPSSPISKTKNAKSAI